MDCAPNVNIFCELQAVHDTGYFSGQISPEEDWQQVLYIYMKYVICACQCNMTNLCFFPNDWPQDIFNLHERHQTAFSIPPIINEEQISSQYYMILCQHYRTDF